MCRFPFMLRHYIVFLTPKKLDNAIPLSRQAALKQGINTSKKHGNNI